MKKIQNELSELRELDMTKLNERSVKLRSDVLGLKKDLHFGKLTSSSILRSKKKQLARVLTRVSELAGQEAVKIINSSK